MKTAMAATVHAIGRPGARVAASAGRARAFAKLCLDVLVRRFAIPKRLRWMPWLLAILACHAVWHAHGIVSSDFQNLDVAGIVYNARLLLAGRLPYLDSVEIKPPGAFLLTAPWLWFGGLRGVWIFSVVWGAGTSLVVGWFAAACWGRRCGWQAALLHAAGAAAVADGDINYSFWMTLPLTMAAAAAAWAMGKDQERRRLSGWFLFGAATTLAVLIRPSAATVVLIGLVALILALSARQWSRAGTIVAGSSLGGICAVVLIAIPFFHHGRFDALIAGVETVRRYSNDSVSSIVQGAGGRFAATLNGLRCLPEGLPVHLLLFALALLPSWRRTSSPISRATAWVPWIFAIVALSGVTLTLRFFTHDNAPLWAATTVLALRPSSLVGTLFERSASRPLTAALLPASLGLLCTAGSWERVRSLQRYLHDSDDRVAAICDRVSSHVGPGEPVLAWGWKAWGVYEHCRRWAPGPIYKDLTTVTTPNTNTCNHGYGPPRLKLGELSRRYLRDLTSQPPAVVVVSDYYKGMGGDPLDEWHDVRLYLRSHYFLLEHLDGFDALVRLDLAPRFGVAPESRAPFRCIGLPAAQSACGDADEWWQTVSAPQ